MSLAAVALAGLGLGLLAPSEARATVLADVPLEDMVADADAVVMGEVIHVGVRVRMDAGTATPWTHTTIDVARWLKKGGGPTVEIVERGGRWQGGGMHIAGTPRYRMGERVVVFLRRDDQGRFRTYGMALGKLTVQAAVDGPTRVVRDLRDVGLASWGPQGMRVEHGYRDDMTLPELLARIEEVLAAVGETTVSGGQASGGALR